MADLISFASSPWLTAQRMLGAGAFLAVILLALSVYAHRRGGRRSLYRTAFLGALCLVQLVIAAGIIKRQYPAALLSGGEAGAGLAAGLVRVIGEIPTELWVTLFFGFGRALQELLSERVGVAEELSRRARR